MSEVLFLNNGRKEYISRASDFRELLDREFGIDAGDYFNSIVEENKVEVKELIGSFKYELSFIRKKLEEAIQQKEINPESIEKCIKDIKELEDDY